MKPSKTIPILIALVILALLPAGCGQKTLPNSAGPVTAVTFQTVYRTPESSVIIPAETLKCRFYNELEFRKTISNLPARQTAQLNFKGGIVPHHLLAGRMIADFFQVLKAQNPELVVLIGPNHKGLSRMGVSTADLDWQTPFGILQSEKTLAGGLVNDKFAAVDNRLMEEEHSISGLVPYIKYYLPDTKILPILVKGNYSLQESEELGQRIHNLVQNKNSVIVSSIDFSHYLSAAQADSEDRITVKALEKRDLQAISLMENDNLDSPPAAISLLTSMNKAGAASHLILDHNNSARILQTGADNTTSYFTIVFYK